MGKSLFKSSLVVGCGLVGFIFLAIVMNAVALLFHGTVQSVYMVAALVLAGAGVYRLARKERLERALVHLAVFVAVVFASVGISTATTDLSWDGNSYHKTAIGAMKNGWNPVWQDVNAFNASDANPYKIQGDKGLDRALDTLWVDHYPKATWLFASSMYAVTGSIESGKSLGVLVLAAVFLTCFGYAAQKMSRNKALVIALLVAANPIAIAQINSYYNDGIVAGLMAILLILLTMFFDKKSKLPGGNWMLYGGIIAVVAIAANVKFTGLAFAGIIMACYWIYSLAMRDWQKLARLTYVGLAALVVAVGIIGASSYVRNTVTNSNPLYPLVGKGSVDFITINQPLNIADKPRVYKFIVMNLVGPTAQISNDQPEYYRYIHPKVPFSVSMDELRFLPGVDTRQGGYGVWFGGILSLTTILGLYALMRYGRQNRRYLALFLLPVVATGVIVIALDGSWWARYVPFLPLVPVLVVGALFLSKEKLLPALLAFTLLFNVSLLAVLSFSEQVRIQKDNRHLTAQLATCTDNRPLYVYSSGRLDGYLYNLHDDCENIVPVGPKDFESWESSAKMLPNGVYVKIK